MKKFIQKILKNRFLTVVSVIAIIGIGYFGYRLIFVKTGPTRYVLSQAQKGTLITAISGSGQVAATNQISIKPKASGDITSVNVVAGQRVKAGTLIATIDSTDALKAVRDAQLSLDSAKLTSESTNNDFTKTYEQTLNYLDSAVSDITTVMAGLKNILFSSSINGNSQVNFNLFISAESFDSNSGKYNNYDLYYAAYQNAETSYEKNLASYKLMDRNSQDMSSAKSLLDETYQTLKLVSETLKNTSNLLGDYKSMITANNLSLNSNVPTYVSNISSYQNTISSDITNILSSINSIDSTSGTPIALQSQQISLQQKQNALADAQQTLTDYYIRAPFDGILASVDAKKGDSASSATAIATIITETQNAEISLSEVDAAKIKIGQKASLTFDAIPDLSITGQVSEIDSIGTVSQGVVTYNAKISLDIQDERIKPSMSVSANIITDSKTDVLLIPNSALKQQNGTYYVLIPNEKISADSSANGVTLNTPPSQKQVQIGSANDEYTEVTSGLNEGDEVVSRTITGSTQTQSSTQSRTPTTGTNALRGIGGGGLGR